MNDDTVIHLGLYCEDLLDQECFKVLVATFEQQCFAHFMGTQPKDKMERESIYLQQQGAKDFLAHISAFVNDKDATLKRIEALSEQDAHIEGID